MTSEAPTPEQMAWHDWDHRRRRRARLAITAWVALIFTLATVFIAGILPTFRLPASSADSSALLSAGLDAAKAATGMLLIILVAHAAWMFLLEYLERGRVLLGERPGARNGD